MRTNSLRLMAESYVQSARDSAMRILGSADANAHELVDLDRMIGVYKMLHKGMPKSNKFKARREGVEVLIAQLKLMRNRAKDDHDKCRASYRKAMLEAESTAKECTHHDWIDDAGWWLRELLSGAYWRLFVLRIKHNRAALRQGYQAHPFPQRDILKPRYRYDNYIRG